MRFITIYGEREKRVSENKGEKKQERESKTDGEKESVRVRERERNDFY